MNCRNAKSNSHKPHLSKSNSASLDFCNLMSNACTVSICKEVLDAILEGAKRVYPRESILLLRGKRKKGSIAISDLVVPPFATRGLRFSSVPVHMLPMDFSIVGTMHSHPSGSLHPSSADLNHAFGSIIMIAAYPYNDEHNVAVYNHDGEKLALSVTEP